MQFDNLEFDVTMLKVQSVLSECVIRFRCILKPLSL